MPANLPPHYFEAEKKFRTARTVLEKVSALEEMLGIMPKHKGTDHLRAELRRRIAKLNQSFEKKLATQRTSVLIDKEGAAQVVVIGPANGGKSQLVGALTNASPEVAVYPFTTQQAIPGMMKYENIQIQLIDTPPFDEQSVEWWLPHMIRRADALMGVVDLGEQPLAQADAIFAELENRKVAAERTRMKVLLVGNKLDRPGAPKTTVPSRAGMSISGRWLPSPPGMAPAWRN